MIIKQMMKLQTERYNKLILAQEFVKKAIEIHGDKYDYSKVNYINARTKVCIICHKHGEFWQTPDAHISKRAGCPKCGLESRAQKRLKSKELFIKEASKLYNNYYDYSKVNYKGSFVKVEIICPKHGSFFLEPASHLLGHGCILCSYEERGEQKLLNTEEFIKRAKLTHGDKYDYSEVNYIKSNIPVSILCPKHGRFLITPANHVYGGSCPKCSLKAQTKVFERLCSEFPNENILFEVGKRTIDWIGNQRLDIFFPAYNIAIEYDGAQHFIPIEHFGGELQLTIQKEADKQKELKCLNNLCTLFRIKYDYNEQDFKNLVHNIREIISKQNEVV